MAKKKKHEEHENHDRWLVSYADFITLLFAFFVVMYSISSVNEGKYRVLSESMVSAFKDVPRSSQPIPIGHPATSPYPSPSVITKHSLPVRKGDPRFAQKAARMRRIAADIRGLLSPLVTAGQVSVTETPQGVAVRINASVLFLPGEAALTGAPRQTLRALAGVLAQIENAVRVEGYSDDLPIRTPLFPSNWELSAARASSVVRLFIEEKVTPERLVAMGYGETRPLADNSTAAGRAKNRRVNVLILSDQPLPEELLSAVATGPGTTDTGGESGANPVAAVGGTAGPRAAADPGAAPSDARPGEGRSGAEKKASGSQKKSAPGALATETVPTPAG